MPDCLVSASCYGRSGGRVDHSPLYEWGSGEVGLAKVTCSWVVTRTAWSFPACVNADYLFCQGNPELFYRFVGQIREITAENEAVGEYQNIKKAKIILISTSYTLDAHGSIPSPDCCCRPLPSFYCIMLLQVDTDRCGNYHLLLS